LKNIVLVILTLWALETSAQRTITKETAKEFSELAIEYQGRIASIGTYARDFTTKITGKTTYKDFNAVQVLAGWLFFAQDWENEPIIRLKHKAIRNNMIRQGIINDTIPNIRLTDFFYPEGTYRLPYLNVELNDVSAREADEKVNLILTIQRGESLKVFPNSNKWYSMTDDLSSCHSKDTLFIVNIMPLLLEKIYTGDEAQIQEIITKIRKFQISRTDGEVSEWKIKLETVYNKLSVESVAFKINLAVALLGFIGLLIAQVRGREQSRILRVGLIVTAILSFVWLSCILGLRIYLSGHLPLSNGYETMMLVAWISLLLTLLLKKRDIILVGGLFICGIALLVCYLSGLNPVMTNLVPVLQSPLLTLHVSQIMIAYSLLAFLAFNSLIFIVLKLVTGKVIDIDRVSYTMLLVAVLLMGSGIFTGAIWANNSWGRYWGWDPKEVWALITFMVYGFALYRDRLPLLKSATAYHIYLLAAFCCVLMTYFGVNLFLGGIHSY
jgi:ABC-type transport system involved in cytochrome c biogenesis permease subunit